MHEPVRICHLLTTAYFYWIMESLLYHGAKQLKGLVYVLYLQSRVIPDLRINAILKSQRGGGIDDMHAVFGIPPLMAFAFLLWLIVCYMNADFPFD